ncbi:hypothetical protein BLA51_20285 [Yersinia pseudotuberculosis]|uniref:YjgN family protein n=1 Tax=Yersinia pseudotuberculosis TaxID=633 RepID=UPI000D0AE895|nr:YjgN family protein [Yersinia pseudotuberculosis]PSH26495.1 hypothetical protein BLA51_20285 [Yersinia pseudotuberculosis]
MADNASQNKSLHRMAFKGEGGEYFSIWLVNLLLTIITLGVYSAWTTVRRRRYFYGNTELNGDRFDYHAEPIEILKGRLMVIGGVILFYILLAIAPTLGLLVALVLLALIPWIIIRSWRYNAIMTSYRGVRFNYHCQTGQAYWALLFCPLLLILGLYAVMIVMAMFLGSVASTPSTAITLIVVSAILLVPLLAVINGIVSTLQHSLYVNNLSFGNSSFISTLKKSAFIKIAFFSVLIFIPFFFVAMMFAGAFFADLFQSALNGSIANENKTAMLIIQNFSNLLFMMLILLLGTMVSSSYRIVAQRNYLFSQTTLQGDIKLRSSMKLLSYMGLLMTNSLITVCSLGLATPIAEVRHARYMANATEIEGDLSLLNIHAHQDTANSALAEEAVQALDLGTGF